jgi:hypothetical protein
MPTASTSPDAASTRSGNDPHAFAGDPTCLARFEQEARAAAALNHSHIAAAEQ